MNEADKSWKRPISAQFYVSGVEAHSDTDRSEGSQVRVEREMESSDESEMEVSGESDEGDSSESVGNSDVIEVQLDNAHGGPNRHSDIGSDDEGVLLRPDFSQHQCQNQLSKSPNMCLLKQRLQWKNL